MGRLHLFEFNDQPWLPTLLRDALTGYLETISRKMGMHEPMVPVLQDLLARTGATRIIDLCSGATGPLLDIRPALPDAVEIVFTDKYPNVTAFTRASAQPGIRAHLESVDATAVPAELSGLRTVFNALHHFRPEAARAILADAARQGAPIAVFELSERTIANVLTAPLIMLFVWIFMPAVKPHRWTRLLFTYLIPIIPLLIFWDGLVSHLRAYSLDELDELTRGLDDDGYTWHRERLPVLDGKAHITVLTGVPAQDPQPRP